MADMLAWLDDLPDMRIGGVTGATGVTPPENQRFSRNTAPEGKCYGVTRITPLHPVAPARVTAEVAENRHVAPVTPVAPPEWNELVQQPGVVGEWARLIRVRAGMADPTSIDVTRWRQVLGDAHAFLTTWGDQAVAMGWTAVDLFSVPPGPDRWLNRAGLVALLKGRPVVAITLDAVTIANPRGGPNRYRRTATHGAVMLWAPNAFSAETSCNSGDRL